MKHIAQLIFASLLLISLSPLGFCNKDSLPRSTPEQEGVDSAQLLKLITALDTQVDAMNSIMLLRNGKVIAEGWWAPYSVSDRHTLYSLTKSFTGTAIGMMVDEGLLDLDHPVISYFPDKSPENPSNNLYNMRVRDLLRMTTGHQVDPIVNMEKRSDGEWTKEFLASELPHRPGIHFEYNSGASYMLSAIVQRLTHKTTAEYLESRLFTPLGIDQPFWAISPEGVSSGAGGMKAYTEDIAKFGQLYLQQGKWKGKQLISKHWVSEATQRQSTTGSGADGNWNYGYGYQFWLNKAGGYRADGAFGQFSLVLPEYNIVLAITSGTEDTNQVMDLIWEHLLPAIHPKKLKANKANQKALVDKLSHLTLDYVAGESTTEKAEQIAGKRYNFPANEQGIEWISLVPNGNSTNIFIKNNQGLHEIHSGFNQWEKVKSDYWKNISMVFNDPQQTIAANGAWTQADTYTAKLCFNETPFTLTMKLQFTGDSLTFDLEHNVRWGPRKHPQLLGQLSKQHKVAKAQSKH